MTRSRRRPFHRALGRVVRKRREWAVVATKFGNVRSADGSFQGINGRPEYVHQACDASLQRTGLDFFDLYFQHRVDPDVQTGSTRKAPTLVWIEAPPSAR